VTDHAGGPDAHRSTPAAPTASIRLLVACTGLLAAAAAATPDSITPDPEIQRQVARVATVPDEQALAPILAKLKELGGTDYSQLVPQLLYYSMRATDVREGMAAAVIVDRLRISKEQQLRAVTPYLSTGDPQLQRELRNMLSGIDGGSATQAPDFGRYTELLRERKDDPPPVLVAHMIETAPDQALAVLAELYVADYQARRSLLANAASRSNGALERLAEHDAWWVRLYVAERLKEDPSLQTPALKKRLQNDPHPAVRAALVSCAESLEQSGKEK
jgi:hypothetical protein